MIHIIGGGIAGLTLAESLGRRGVKWCIYEKSSGLGSEASGKNAGIIRTYEADPVIAELAQKSLEYYRDTEPGFSACGLILNPWEIAYSSGPQIEMRNFTHGRSAGQYLPENGTVEPQRVLERLRKTLSASGEIHFGTEQTPVFVNDTVSGFLSGESLSEEDLVVVCAGAGSISVGGQLPLTWEPGLIAHRRTLYVFSDRERKYAGRPVEWDEHSGVYFRAVPEGLLVTAGEQIPVAMEQGDEDSAEIPALLYRELPHLQNEKLIASRSCRRLTSLDNRPYCGRDPKFKNLFWFTGLGGRGMSIAPALATCLAELLTTGRRPLLEKHFSPSRALK